MGWVCLVKKPKKNMWSTAVPGYLGYVSREMGSYREMKPKWFCEDYDSCFALHCSVHLRASVQGV